MPLPVILICIAVPIFIAAIAITHYRAGYYKLACLQSFLLGIVLCTSITYYLK